MLTGSITFVQELLFTSLGSTENELHHLYQDARLAAAPTRSSSIDSAGEGVCLVVVMIVLGRDIEIEVGKSLGLTFGQKAKGTVKPLYVQRRWFHTLQHRSRTLAPREF